MQNFSELPISSSLKKRLEEARFSIPTDVQAATIPQAAEGKDVLATAQTGTGKTLAFLIPVIDRLMRRDPRGIEVLVLVPTRELAMQVAQQFDGLRGKELTPAALAVGGLSEGPQLSAIRKGARIMVATPGRLEDFIGRQLISLGTVQTLVLDEADRMLDMGFLPAIRRIIACLPKDRQTLCFSATLEASVENLIKTYMKNPVRLAFGPTGKPSENVRLQAFEVSIAERQQILCHLLAQEKGRCLIFSRTKRGTERIAKFLNWKGIEAGVIHGDRSQSQRTAALAEFQHGRCRVLVATDVASRGIHVENVAHVINYDLPELAENFIHRVGRTGRAGARGIASTFFLREQGPELLQLERTLRIQIERMPVDSSFLEKQKDNYKGRGNSQESRRTGRLVCLPGEFLQAQMNA
jgi:ATP-dependent RNA helicase RhlE